MRKVAKTIGVAIALVVLWTLAGCTERGGNVEHLLEASSGGATSVVAADRHAFSRPAANLNVNKRAAFAIGNAFFNSAWIVAPASAGARDGLGPLFNARSCDACHNNDGRGRPPEHGERPVSLVIQFATPTPGENNEPGADPRYGVNLNPFAIGNVPAEGTVRIRHRKIHGQFADGEPYTLLAPEYGFDELAYGELAPSTGFSPRTAPSVFGVGLLEAVPEWQILERSDPDDADGDGISGRPNRVWDHEAEQIALGRLGWKANQPNIAHQTAAAFAAEIGMSTSLRPEQNCTSVQAECNAAPTGGEPEISDEIFGHMVQYQRTLGVPVRRNLDSEQVKAGARLFSTVGCAACHRSTFSTEDFPDEPALSHQTFHPFTDLLLHDMGDALADNRIDFEAAPNEWRTAPLWGLGLQEAVNGHTRLLHDGRARNVSEAILWHGGEAQRSQRAYLSLSKQERDALLAFLNSL